MRPVKVVQFYYVASEELTSLFEDFRLMCNDAIRIAFKAKPRSRFQLIELAYPQLKVYGLHSHYTLSACEVAYSLFRNRNLKSTPYVKKSFLKLDNQSYTLNHLILRIPTKPRRFIYLTLQGSDYHLSFIDDACLRKGSITVTERTANISFSTEDSQVKPMGFVGIDVNERNITTSDTLGNTRVYDTSEVVEIKERYKEIRAKIGRRTRQDNRVSQRLYAKYGLKEKNRTMQPLHRISKDIVRKAKENHLAIIMEDLKGIRKLYRKGNGQGKLFRGRMNSWVFHEDQRQIEYKAKWEGVLVIYLNPQGTSRNCPNCGSRVAPLRDRILFCPKCDKTWDRDVLAAKNLAAMAALVHAARPSKRSSDGEPRQHGEYEQSSERMDGSLLDNSKTSEP